MAMLESCARCGRPLTQPGDAEAKANPSGGPTVCPECGGANTDVEPILWAELVEADPDPCPIAIAGPDPHPNWSPSANLVEPPRRPCPMCGESISSAALRCRFCGEVFDSRLGRTVRSRVGAGDETVGVERKQLLACLFVSLGCLVAMWVLGAQAGESTSGLLPLVFLAIAATYLAATITAMIVVFRLLKRMAGAVAALFGAGLVLVPCVGLLVELLVYQRAAEFDRSGAEVPEPFEEL